jgi:glucose dehydrogenase
LVLLWRLWIKGRTPSKQNPCLWRNKISLDWWTVIAASALVPLVLLGALPAIPWLEHSVRRISSSALALLPEVALIVVFAIGGKFFSRWFKLPEKPGSLL